MDVHFRYFYIPLCLMNAASFIFPSILQRISSLENAVFPIHWTIVVSERKAFKLNKWQCKMRKTATTTCHNSRHEMCSLYPTHLVQQANI